MATEYRDWYEFAQLNWNQHPAHIHTEIPIKTVAFQASATAANALRWAVAPPSVSRRPAYRDN